MAEKQRPWTISGPRIRKDANGQDQTKWGEVGIAWPREDGGYTLDFFHEDKVYLLRPPFEGKEGENAPEQTDAPTE